MKWSVNTAVLEVVQAVWKGDLQIGLPSNQPIVVPPSPVQGLEKGTEMTEAQKEKFTEWKRMATRLYTADKERISQGFQVSRILRMAAEYKEYEDFYYVWYADFRGRLYSATSGFSPQGPDMAKGCLRFANGKPLGDRGWYWLRVHIANRFGYDKVSYDDRVRWVDDQRVALLRTAEDPLSYRNVWANADKPYQFLAAVFEYAGACKLSDPGAYVSHLPIGLDGSCNGLQNFSAMLRDAAGGEATNLVPGEKPNDIYARVADVTLRKIKERLGSDNVHIDVAGHSLTDHFFAERWLAYGIDRKITKRPVMTLPYGATRQSCTEYIWEALVDK
ncbi:MAG: DNA-directed RNA polymerase, partial [Sweet potato little leaf phytoplasma]|nr:DNA-directed RNA polymerase [Sweet potato little leaf phytoplasma]